MNKQELTPAQHLALQGLMDQTNAIANKLLAHGSYDLQADLLALSCTADALSKKLAQIGNEVAKPSRKPDGTFRDTMNTEL